VNVTVSGEQPLVAEAVKAAVGAPEADTVCVNMETGRSISIKAIRNITAN
jgi:hypothetical protein